MKKMILLDLDNTLFDSSSFRSYLYDAIGSASADPMRKEEVIKTAQAIYDDLMKQYGIFDPDLFSNMLLAKEKLSIDKVGLIATIFHPDTLHTHYHDDTLETLEKLGKLGEIGIFTQGSKAFQQAKMASLQSLLQDKHVYITENKREAMADVFGKYAGCKIFFVDDMLPMLQAAKLVNSAIITIWIKRGRYASKQEPLAGFCPDFEVDDLKSVISIIEKS